MVKYRKDIEGLRAIAVSSILLFHFGYEALGGGYVGVDIFFVISGFLIGKSVINQTIDRTFSFPAFFERRVRRLYPALVAMLLACCLIGPLLLLPQDLVSFGDSLIATSAYISNIFFFGQAGYFDSSAILKPLLHTWSLAVEEQFYIFFPLLMMPFGWLRASRKVILAAVVAMGLASFAAAEIYMTIEPAAAFYLFPLRAWELLVGVGVGAFPTPAAISSKRWLRETLAALGLALTIGTIILYAPATTFPGLHAVPPVLGAALVIMAGSGGKSAAGTLLSLKPFALIGLVSYSLYLWHWPLVVFLTYYKVGTLPQLWRIGGILATIALAALSYRYVEEPFRWRRGNLVRLFVSTAAVSLLLIAIGAVFHKTRGLPSRYSKQELAIADPAAGYRKQPWTCYSEKNPVHPGLAYCLIGDPKGTPDFLVWADSHGRVFHDGIDLAARASHRTGLMLWKGGCPPLIGVHKTESVSSPATDALCFDRSQKLAEILERDHALRDVLLIGRWAYYTNEGGIGADAHNRITFSGPPGSSAAIFAKAMRATVDRLDRQGRHVFILEQVPEIPFFGQDVLGQRVFAARQPLDQALAAIAVTDRKSVEARQRVPQALFAELAAGGKATILRTHPYFCSATRCSAWQWNEPALYDNNHIAGKTSVRMQPVFDPLFRPADAPAEAPAQPVTRP
jgi:peptidoglycan/LPS O-acetylase OafA/YrhL